MTRTTSALALLLGALAPFAPARDPFIRIRSFLDSAYPPVPTDYECQRDGRTVEVQFKASLATRT